MFLLQGSGDGKQQLFEFLKNEIATQGYNRISACAAYATYRGTILIRNLLADKENPQYRWLIGLDDTFSDPKALRIAMNSRGADLRLVKLMPGRRFHPKAYLLDLNDAGTATLVVGSCNLTEGALTKNCEVYATHRVETEDEVREVQTYWESLWNMGKAATEKDIKVYEELYKSTPRRAPVVQEEKENKKPPKKIKQAVKDSVKTTSLAWIVLGKNTGGGGQLDIVKKLAPFLGLSDAPTQGTTVNLRIKTSTGMRDYQVTFTKGMWRFMNLQQGFNEPLRPDANKASPYILVIERPKGGGNLEMKILSKTSKEAKDMVEQSNETGFTDTSVPSPSGRLYGWY